MARAKGSESSRVYVVLQPANSQPKFLKSDPGGRFKDRDPTVGPEALTDNWLDRAEVVYIGKADDLRRRIREFMRFGQGAPIGHWGGRLIWQLAGASDLRIAWRETPGEIPRAVESRMLEDFRSDHGQPPFANDPHRLGR